MNHIPLGELIRPARPIRAGDRKLPILSITMKDGLVDQSARFSKTISSNDTAGYKVINRGQLVVGFPIDEGVLDFQEAYDSALVSPAYKIWDIIDPEIVDREFLSLFLRSPFALHFYKSKLRGTTARRRSLPDQIFLQLKVPLPPIEEQQLIAQTLDSISQYSSLISNRAHKINLLKKYISEEIEGGNYNFSELAQIRSSTVDPTTDGRQHLRHIAPNNIESGTGRLLEVRTCEHDGVTSGKYEFFEGDVLYSKIRPYLNKVTIAPYHGLCSADMYAITPCDGFSSELIASILTSSRFLRYAESASNRASIPKINRKDLLTYKLSKPTEEQDSSIRVRWRHLEELAHKNLINLKSSELLYAVATNQAFSR